MIIKLGFAGSLLPVFTESLTLPSVEVIDNSFQSRSANKTLHIDYIPPKENQPLNYDVLSKDRYEYFLDLYKQQGQRLDPLVLQIERSTGLKSYNVYMSPPTRGADLFDKNYYYQVSIGLTEV